MKTSVFTALTLAGVLSACGGSSTGINDGGGGGNDAGVVAQNIVEVASANPEFSSLVAAVTKAGLASTLQDASKQFTVFAPTNAAFAALLTSIGATSLNDVSAEQLKPILLYHVIGSKVDGAAATAAATASQKVPAVGGKIQLEIQAGKIRLDGKANVVTPDVAASNGVIHVIDAVILPSALDIVTTDERFSSLAAAAVAANGATPSPNYLSTLDNDALPSKLTVFAPTNDAFTALVTALKGSDNGAATGINALTSFRPDQLVPVINYHLMGSPVFAKNVPASGNVDSLGGKLAVTRSGSSVTIDGVPVVIADVIASNAVIHAIGSVLVPSITDVLTTAPEFSSLKGALVGADSASGTTPKVGATLDGTSKFTIFAPTNAAFTALGAAPSGQSLTNVLLYHAAPGNPVYAATALGLSSPLSVSTGLSGKTVSVNAEGAPKGVTVADGVGGKAKVQVTNWFTSNGVIHAIDRVLIPAP